MSILIRPLLVPGVALATVGAVALGPTLVVPPAMTLAQPTVQIPAVHVEDIQLAGFTLDLYNALDGWLQFGVQVLQDLFFWSPAIAAQIGTLYTTLQPIVTAVVTFIDTLISGPTDIIGALTGIVTSLFGIAVPSLSAAAVGQSATPRSAARAANGRRGAVAPVPAAEPGVAETPDAAEVPVPARASRGELHRAVRSAVAGVGQVARSAAVEVAAGAAEISTAAPSTARATRGSATKAGREARGSVTAGADAAT